MQKRNYKEEIHELIDKIGDNDEYFFMQIFSILYRYFEKMEEAYER